MIRLKKSVYQLITDLRNHLFLLDLSIKGINDHPAFFILMATQLRSLVTKSSGQVDLLMFLAHLFKVRLYVTMDNKFESNKKISFNSYLLNKVGCTFHGKTYTNVQFVKLMANSSGDYLHILDTSDERLSVGSNIFFNDLNINQIKLISIAKTTSSVAHKFFDYLEKLNKSDVEKINLKLNPSKD
jgi:hypothetical protein